MLQYEIIHFIQMKFLALKTLSSEREMIQVYINISCRITSSNPTPLLFVASVVSPITDFRIIVFEKIMLLEKWR